MGTFLSGLAGRVPVRAGGLVATWLAFLVACGGAQDDADVPWFRDHTIVVLTDLASPDLQDPGPADPGQDLPADEPDTPDARDAPDGYQAVPCQTPADCPPAWPVCPDTLKVCARCSPGERTCLGNVARNCSEDGLAWIDFSCPGACKDGGCLACYPDVEECRENTARKCRSDGSAWDETPCEAQVCLAGKCVACVPGESSCVDGKVQTCREDASGWDLTDCDTATTGLVCVAGKCADLCLLGGSARTNQGCEYWAIDMDQSTEKGGADAQYAVVVSNASETLTAWVAVSNAGGEVTKVQAPPRTATIINLPPQNIAGVVKDKLAWRIKANMPIVAYQFNPLENVGVYSNDASLLLPTNVLGKSYRVLAWPHRQTEAGSQPLASNFAVVGATPGDTQVTVKVSVATVAGTNVPALNAGQTWTTTLAQYEVLNLESRDPFTDLTGSTVEASAPVAVFGGHVCANTPLSRCVGGFCSYDPIIECKVSEDCPIIGACDHLEEQLQPVAAWGQTYVLGRTWPRGKAPDLIRVLASQDLTHVTLDPPGAAVPVLGAGKVHEFEIMDHVVLTADKPVLVGQYLEGQNAPYAAHSACASTPFGKCCAMNGSVSLPCAKTCNTDKDCDTPDDANIGDPSFIVGVPVEQFRQEYVFLVPTKYAFSYVNITAPVDAQVALDDNPLTVGWTPVGTGGSWTVLRLQLQPGSHTLSSDRKIGVVVYGWDQYVSYGYPGGMSLENLVPGP